MFITTTDKAQQNRAHIPCDMSYMVHEAGPRFNIKLSSYNYRKSHCGDKTVVRPSHLHNGISYTGNWLPWKYCLCPMLFMNIKFNHHSVIKIKSHYNMVIENCDFLSVDADAVMLTLKNISPDETTEYDLIPGKLIRIAHADRGLSGPLCHIINISIELRSFPGIMKCVSQVYRNTDNLKKNLSGILWMRK